MDELLGELNWVIDCVAYADHFFILTEGNSLLELDLGGTECICIVSTRSLKVVVVVSTEMTEVKAREMLDPSRWNSSLHALHTGPLCCMSISMAQGRQLLYGWQRVALLVCLPVSHGFHRRHEGLVGCLSS